MKIIKHSSIILSGLLLVSCGESSFSGTTSRSVPTSETNDPSGGDSSTTTDNNMPDEDKTADATPCVDKSKTTVNLLTTNVKNNAAGQMIRYEVSLLDCMGNPKPIPEAPLLFDVDAVALFDITNFKVPYSVQDSSSNTLASGGMNLISGSDLFGVAGVNRYHWRIDSFTIKNGDKKLYLNLDVSNLAWQPSTGATADAAYVFSTYLRIGDAEPVEQKVTWEN